jgi:hypothetical protein
MHTQHLGLSELLAEQHRIERREHAARVRLAHQARWSRRRRRWLARGWWQLARWPAIATEQPARRPQRVS